MYFTSSYNDRGKLIKGIIMYYIIEKNNPLAVHAICDSLERAQHWLDFNAPMYCECGYFMDKTLTPESFTIREE
jgi:hypothetical protein